MAFGLSLACQTNFDLSELMWNTGVLYLKAQMDFQVEESVETAVFRPCTSCRTEFWVIQQNRKYLLEFYIRLGDRLEITSTQGSCQPPDHYFRTGTETSRLLQLYRKSTPDFWPDSTRLPRTGSLTSAVARYPLVQPGSTSNHGKRRF